MSHYETLKEVEGIFGGDFYLLRFFCCFSGGSECGSTRNKKPPAMPVRLRSFSFKQKTSHGTISVVPQPHNVTKEVMS